MIKPVSEYLTATRQFFGDGEYWLFLPLQSATKLEKKITRPLSRIYGQLLASFFEQDGKLMMLDHGHVSPEELNEIVRFGLMGGNSGPSAQGSTEVGPQRADHLISMYGYPSRPVEEVAAVAFRLLHAAWHGDPMQREAFPEAAAASDAQSERQSKQAAELLGPTMRKRAEEAAG